jgi:membrane-bound serine protease (ClpP class)
VGQVGVARTALEPEGQVFVHGALWRAVADGHAVGEGEAVKVVGMDGLTLRVTRTATG